MGINEQVDHLIQSAEELKNVAYDSPRVDLWKRRVKDFVKKTFGFEFLEIFEKSIRWGVVAMQGQGQSLHLQAMDKAIDFLESLKHEPIPTSPMPENPNNQINSNKKSEHKISSISISGGTVIMGDGNTLTQISVKDLIEVLEKEIKEKVPESEERNNVLSNLYKITTNPTFASVSGSFLGEVLKKLSGI